MFVTPQPGLLTSSPGRPLGFPLSSSCSFPEYLRFRLARIGCDKELFSSDAIAMLHEAASGALRDLDRLATAAIRETARKKGKLVEREVLARIARRWNS